MRNTLGKKFLINYRFNDVFTAGRQGKYESLHCVDLHWSSPIDGFFLFRTLSVLDANFCNIFI